MTANQCMEAKDFPSWAKENCVCFPVDIGTKEFVRRMKDDFGATEDEAVNHPAYGHYAAWEEALRKTDTRMKEIYR